MSMLPGKLYELAIFTNTLLNNPDKHFDIGQEIIIGDKFDDLVVRDSNQQYTFVQIKLVDDMCDENGKKNLIDSKVLLGETKISLNKDDFKLQKYFHSYLRIKDQLKSRAKNSAIAKLIIFTNADLNHEEITKEVGVISIMQNINDYILNTNTNLESYKITNPKKQFIRKIRENLNSDLEILAAELSKYVTDCNTNLEPMVLDVDCFRYYHTALLDENVLEVKDCQHGNKKIKLGKFTQNFIDGTQLSCRAQRLRTILTEQNKKQKLLENMTKAEWKVSDDFGLNESIDGILLPSYAISDRDVEDFFSILEFRVKQLGVKDLLNKIKDEEIKKKILEYSDTNPKLVEFLINNFVQDWRNESICQERWLLNSKRSEFIKQLQIKIAKPQAIHTTQEFVKYIENIIRKYNLQFHDACLFNENYFGKDKKESFFLVSTASNILSSIKMLEYLKKKNIENYIFIDLERLAQKREIVKLVDAFKDDKYSLFILSYKSLVEKDIVEELFNKFSSVQEHRNKQVIFITSTADCLIKKINIYKEYKDNTNGTQHLVNSSRILEQKISFYETSVKMGDLCNHVSPEILDTLITDHICIGDNAEELNYFDGAHSELFEEINMISFVNELLLEQSTNIFVISGIPGKQKADVLLKEMRITNNNTINTLKRQIKQFEQDTSIKLKSNIYVCGDQFKDRHFKKMCKNSPEGKILYWIYLKNESNISKFMLAQIYNPTFYIKGQRFNSEIVINKTIKEQLQNLLLSEKFLISGTNKAFLKNWFPLNNEEGNRFEVNCNKNIQFHSSHTDLNYLFQDIVEQGLDETVHLLKFENKQLIWCNTHGSVVNLSKYRIEDNSESQSFIDEDDIVRNIKDKKVVIIAGEPGIGKSTALVKLYGLKYKLHSATEESINMTHWVIKISLKDHLQAIRNINFSETERILSNTIDFLSQIDKNLKHDFAKYFLGVALTEKDFGKPLLIAFDGFDEILDKDDRENVLMLLKYLKHKTNAKFWVTTRVHYENLLEKELSIFSIRLGTLDFGKVRLYIEKYLHSNLRLVLDCEEVKSIFENRIETDNASVLYEYTEAFLNKIQEIFKSDVSWFIGTPLQLYLMLEGSARYFKQWIKNRTDNKPDFHYLGSDMWEVYNKFTERKYNTYLKKREIIGSAKQNLEKTVFDDYHRDLAKSFILESDVKKSYVEIKDIVLLAGIIRSDGTNVEFIHPTFQEYFVARLLVYWIEKWSREQHYKLTNSLKKEYLMNNILSISYYKVIRSFLNVKFLSKEFKNAHLDERYYNDKILSIAILEKHMGIARFLLNNFQSANVDGVTKNLFDNCLTIESPLETAASSGNLQMLELLVKYSAYNGQLNKLYSSLLLNATESGNVVMVKYLIDNGANINTRDDFDETALHKAVSRYCNFEMVKYLVQNRIEVNARSALCGTALFRAVRQPRNLEIIKFLVENGANVNDEDDFCKTVLHSAVSEPGNFEVVKFLLEKRSRIRSENEDVGLYIAVKNGDIKIVKLLLDSGADCNAIYDYNEKVIFAAVTQTNNLEMVRLLVQYRANVNDINGYGETVIFKAVAQPGNIEVVKYLVENGADLKFKNKHDETIIHIAVSQPSNLDVVKFLIGNQVDIHIRNRFDETALNLAVENGDLETVKFLIQNGANIHVRNRNGRSILCSALVRPNNFEMVKYLAQKCPKHDIHNVHDAVGLPGHFEKIKFLIEIGLDINSKNRFDEIILLTAVKYGDFNLVEYLVHNEAHIDARDKDGKTVLCCAVTRGNYDMVSFLVQNGADIHGKNTDNTTALHVAAELDDMKTVKLLVSHGLKVDIKAEHDLKVLLIATEGNNLEMLEFLIRHSLNIDCLEKLYTVLLHVAPGSGCLEMVKYLVNNGADINDKDKHGATVLYKAVGDLDVDGILKYQFRKKVKDNAADKTDINDSLVVLQEALKNFQTGMVKFLLQNGAAFDLRTKEGNLVLKRAAQCNKLEVLKVLVDYSVNKGQLDKVTSSVFRDAVLSENFEMVKFLADTYDKEKDCVDIK